MSDSTSARALPMDQLEARAAALFEDDMEPLTWASATDQQKIHWAAIAAEIMADEESRRG